MRSKANQLRDEIVAAAMAWERYDPDGPVNLLRAVREYNVLLAPIVDSDGSYVNGSPETSGAAALQLRAISSSIRKDVLNEIYSVNAQGLHGLTDHDLELRLRMPHQTVSSARNWLVEGRWLEDSGYRKTSDAGRKRIIWRATDIGVQYLRGAS